MRQALKLCKGNNDDASLVGAARANLGLYLVMQKRYEDATHELVAGAKILGCGCFPLLRFYGVLR